MPETTKAIGRELAGEIARRLGARVLPNHKNAFDEPHAYFRVPIHVDPFWMTIKVAANAFVFDALHRRGDGPPVSFGVALGHPYRNMAASKPSKKLSSLVGIDVFTADHFGELDMEPYASLMLETPSLSALIQQLPLDRIAHCYLNDSQLSAVVKAAAADQAVSDILLLRSIMIETHKVSRFYHPDL